MAGVQIVAEKPAQASSGASTATGKAPAAASASGQALAAANGTGDKRDATPLPAEPAKDVVDAAEDGEDEDDDADAAPGEPHPLQFRWSMWHDQPLKTPRSAWGAELREIASFDTVEGFWAYVSAVARWASGSVLGLMGILVALPRSPSLVRSTPLVVFARAEAAIFEPSLVTPPDKPS
jgi:Eukaryotic initiation factor 4E